MASFGSLVQKKAGAVTNAVTAAFPASPPPMDLSFLNDPNNPYYQQPSGDSGYYSAPAPAPKRDLASSPEWQAYLAALGLDRSQFEANIQRQRELTTSQAGFQAAGVEPQYSKQRRGITSGSEGRGMLYNIFKKHSFC